jgi:hypothetical protein
MVGEKIPNWKARVGLHVNTIPIIVFLIRKYKALQIVSESDVYQESSQLNTQQTKSL